MNQAFHIFRKDLVRYWPLIALAWTIIACDLLAVYFGLVPAGNKAGPSSEVLMAVIKWPMVFLLVVALVQEDGPAGLHSFWFTRPVEPGALFGAKLLVCSAALVAPTWLGHTWLAAALDGAAPVVLAVGIEAAGLMLVVVACTAVLAALTRSILQAGAVVFVLLLLVLVLQSLWPRPAEALPKPFPEVSVATRMAVTLALTVLSFFALLRWHYSHRRVWRSAVLAIAALLVSWLGGRYWTIPLIPEPTPPPVTEAREQSGGQASFEIKPEGPAQAIRRSSSYDPVKGTRQELEFVSVPVSMPRPPGNLYFEPILAESELLLADGSIRKFRPLHPGYRFYSSQNTNIIKAALGLPAPAESDRQLGRLNVLRLPVGENPMPPSQPARLTSRIKFNRHAFAVEIRLPLQRGAVLPTGGETWHLDSIFRHEQSGFALTVRKQRVTSMLYPVGLARPDISQPDPALRRAFVLHNRRLGEYVIGNMPLSYSTRTRGSVEEQLFRPVFSQRYGLNLPGPVKGIDQAWLADAELLILTNKKLGELDATLTIDNFTLTRQEAPPVLWQ